jgi:membrane-associated phospholipid phosphatase
VNIAPGTTLRLSLAILLLTLLTGIQCAAARDSIEKRGDALAVLIPAIGLGSTLLYEDGYDGTLQFAESFATSQLTTEVLKHVTHKERPNGSCCKSFPSGHTSAAFMGAAFIHQRYGWQYALPAYVGAAYAGFTRVHAKKHYWVDVGAGAAIGVASSFYFTEPYKGLTVTPVADGDTFGIQLSKRW